MSEGGGGGMKELVRAPTSACRRVGLFGDDSFVYPASLFRRTTRRIARTIHRRRVVLRRARKAELERRAQNKPTLRSTFLSRRYSAAFQ